MNLVYLSDAIIPSRSANSIQVMKMCSAFARLGHRVCLLVPEYPSREPAVADCFAFYGVERNFTLQHLPWVAMKGRKYLYGLRAGMAATRLKPDVVYGRCLLSCVFAMKLGLPAIYEAHMLLEHSGRQTRWILASLIRGKRLKRLVVISEALRQAFLSAYNIPQDKIIVAHDAADPPLRAICIQFENDGRLQVGYVGHLYPGKGMEIIAELAKACSWAEFHVIGGREADIEHWRGVGPKTDNIKFYGFLPHSETDSFRLGCDVLLAPYQHSVSMWAGGNIAQWMSPLKIFEYMAAGKAILASDLPVLREVLTHGENSWLCDPTDANRWVEALAYLRDHPDVREFLGKRAKGDFEAAYTWKARAKKVLTGISL